MDYNNILKDIDKSEEELVAITEQYQEKYQELSSKIAELYSLRDLAENGRNIDLISQAKTIIKVKKCKEYNEYVDNSITSAIDDIRRDCEELKTQQFVVKKIKPHVYSDSQEEYDYVGKDIYFSVALKDEYKQKSLTSKQKVACIYMLNSLRG